MTTVANLKIPPLITGSVSIEFALEIFQPGIFKA
jgi:hypothetical protein